MAPELSARLLLWLGLQKATILNNGHTIQVNCAPGSRTLVAGQAFDLLQFHFYHPSEHLLAGGTFDLELHFREASANPSTAAAIARPK